MRPARIGATTATTGPIPTVRCGCRAIRLSARMSDIPAKIAQLADYWRSLDSGAAPERHLLDPAAIKPLLPYVLLVEFEDDPFRVRYRLTGTKVDEMTGINITGRYLDEFAQEPYRTVIEGIQRSYQTCRAQGQAMIETYLWPNEGGLLRHVW